MNVTRVAFLRTCAAVALGRCVDVPWWIGAVDRASTSGGASLPPAGLRLEDASAELFREHVHTAFRIRSGDGDRQPVILASVTEQPINEHCEQFSLIFHAPAGAALSHGTHAFQHPVLGAFDLFIVPVGGAHARRTAYEACFSRNRRSSPREGEACRTPS